MARKRRTKTNVMKYACMVTVALCAVELVLWWVAPGYSVIGGVLILIVTMAAILPFWALGEQFRFSFGKSRYLTRTERKRLRHQRKTQADGKPILGRETPEQHDR